MADQPQMLRHTLRKTEEFDTSFNLSKAWAAERNPMKLGEFVLDCSSVAGGINGMIGTPPTRASDPHGEVAD
jgi:hypothetical protein